MRDAFGGAFMIKIFLVFIIVYVSFTALALNYAKAFKVKNTVINYIENNEETNFNNMNAKEIMNMQNFIDTEVHGKLNYIGSIKCGPKCNINDGLNTNCDTFCEDGIRIERISKSKNVEGNYFKVSTSIGWNIHFFNLISNFDGRNHGEQPLGKWIISGETRLIVNDDD